MVRVTSRRDINECIYSSQEGGKKNSRLFKQIRGSMLYFCVLEARVR